MTDDIAIKVENLTKIYKLYDKPIDRLKESLHPGRRKYHKDFYALRNISFTVKQGDTIGLIGRNGAGKSTLLKLITGVITPTAGSVKVNGRIAALLELGAGFNPECSGMDNIFMQGTIMGYSREEMFRRAPAIIEFADIGEYIMQPVRTYSSGMLVRLAFAIAVNVEPDILVVDEALSVGDMNFQVKCMSKIGRMQKKGVTLLFVSHAVETVKALCNAGIYLKQGEIVVQGKATEVSDRYFLDMRAELNKENESYTEVDNGITTVSALNNSEAGKENCFQYDEEFQKRVKDGREGTGDVIIANVELLNAQGERTNSVFYNQKVCARLHVLFVKNAKAVVEFVIRDEKNMPLLVSNTMQKGIGMLEGREGQKAIVDFRFPVPLNMGIYSIVARAYYPIVPNQSNIMYDHVYDTWVFHVNDSRISGKVAFQNTAEVHFVE